MQKIHQNKNGNNPSKMYEQRANFQLFSKDALQFMLLSKYDNNNALDNILMHRVI